LEKVEEESGTVNPVLDKDGNVSVLFMSTKTMREAFREFACETAQIDTNFDIDSSKCKLCAFCYLHPTTNKSEFCALTFLSDETAKTFEAAFLLFKTVCCVPPAVIFVDNKDFNEINVLKKVFPSAAILLCNFHVIKYVKNLIATALVKVEVKDEIMTYFKSMMYARSEEAYNKRRTILLLSVEGVQVRANKKYILLSEQFLNNWHTSKEMWVAYYRRELPTYGDNTSNRIKRSFWTLKQSLEHRFCSSHSIHRSIIHVISFCDDQISNASL